ncbi:MAG: alpha/beta hydrolase [Candidatus Thioglobus sp.]|jgi:pimeloyl-ACP methyl ester carboxylesterase|nr:alpha/beta hydrolase [Candidatus Thioglobus sp.]|tara:strand:+ start:2349 stop:3041 length:693 start_codon:yes stop_codon:yes gene_type:complete
MTPVVMIPGMMCDERIFAHQIEELGTDTEVYIADISKYSSIQELASDVLENSPPKFFLVGHSMGGIVAMEMCSQEPDRIEKLVIMDSNPKPELEETKLKREPQIRDVVSGNLAQVMKEEMKPNYLADSYKQKDILNTCMEMALTLGPEVFVRQSRALQGRDDQQSTLEDLDIPVLIMCGSEDKLCSLEKHELMHNIINDSKLEVVMGAGHMPTLEQPQKTTEVIKSWLMN